MKLKNTLPTDLQVDLLLNYFNSFVEDAYFSQTKKAARKRLEFRRREAKENIPLPKEEASSQSGSEEISTASFSSSLIEEDTPVKEELKRFLDEMADKRKKNELIYGYKENLFSSQINKRWGIEASEAADCYKNDFDHTSTSDFIITFDNKIFLNLPVDDPLMGGCFLKAAGSLRIENNKLHITPYNRYFGGVPGYQEMPIILFVLQEKGFPVTRENICVTDNEAAIDFYLNENRFPSAKTLAGNKKISLESSLAELFLNIDDEILNARSQDLIKAVDIKRTQLQANIINFLLLVANFGEKKDKIQEEVEEAPLVVVEETPYQCYEKIVNCIQEFKIQYGRDISFIKSDLIAWSYYLIALSFQVESDIKIGYEASQALLELIELKKSLKKIKESPSTIPQRLKNDVIETYFLKFYTENPLKTCISLLRDYTKGGFFRRFFSGAWNRQHIKAVNKFLQSYEQNRLPEDISIQTIYQILFGEVNTISEYSGKRGTLYARLLFCARLNNEIESSESLNYPSSSTFVEDSLFPEAITETLNRDNLNVGDPMLSMPKVHSRRTKSLSLPNELLINKQLIESYPNRSLRKLGVFYPPNSDELFDDKKISSIPLPASASTIDDQSISGSPRSSSQENVSFVSLPTSTSIVNDPFISRSPRSSSQENISFFSPARGEVSDSEKTSSYGSPTEPSVLSPHLKEA